VPARSRAGTGEPPPPEEDADEKATGEEDVDEKGAGDRDADEKHGEDPNQETSSENSGTGEDRNRQTEQKIPRPLELESEDEDLDGKPLSDSDSSYGDSTEYSDDIDGQDKHITPENILRELRCYVEFVDQSRLPDYRQFEDSSDSTAMVRYDDL